MFGFFDSSTDLPRETRGVGLVKEGAQYRLTPVIKPLRPLKKNEVLVRMRAASINPSDLLYLRSEYGISATDGVIPGLEGSGEIIAAGKGFTPKLFANRRVACTPRAGEDGTWADYCITSVQNCVPLLPSLSFEEGASLIVNPLSAWLLFAQVKDLSPTSILLTAASGALGGMLVKLGQSLGYTMVCVVHREELIDEVKAGGAAEVIVSTSPGFETRLREACHRYDTRVVLDGAAGRTTEIVVKALPRGATVLMYGSLDGNRVTLSASDFIFSGITVRGFWLYNFARSASKFNMAKTFFAVQRKVKRELATPVTATYPLEDIDKAIAYYKEHRSRGKVILTMERGSSQP